MGLLAALCAAVAVQLLQGPARRGAVRLRSLDTRSRTRATRRSDALVTSSWARTVLCAGAVSVISWVVLGSLGPVVGIPAGMAISIWIGRLEPPDLARAREQIAADLPRAVDLLAACCLAGSELQQVLPVVGRAVGGPLGDQLVQISARLSLGAAPDTEWGRLAADPRLGALGRALLRSIESGAPQAQVLTRLAEDQRRDRHTQTQLRARNVGVRAAAPLAACFLPAFMLIGVVPTVAGSFERLFG